MMITAPYHLLTIMNCVIGQFFNILLQKPSGLILIIYYLFITAVNRMIFFRYLMINLAGGILSGHLFLNS